MLPLAQIFENNKIKYQNYSDDTHVYVTLSPGDYSPMHALSGYIEQIERRMSQNVLNLNMD